MFSATLMFLAAAAAPVAATSGADTIRHLKGHHSLPIAPAARAVAKAPVVCNPDPLKGRACRHHLAKRDESREQRLAQAGADASRRSSAQ